MRARSSPGARSSDEELEPGTRGGFDGGALVLTTARSTAGGIADYLATELRQRGDETPVLSALVLGNNRGYHQFTDFDHGGGFLVGTKGLWQGVDVADEKRLDSCGSTSCRSRRSQRRSSRHAGKRSRRVRRLPGPKTRTRSRRRRTTCRWQHCSCDRRSGGSFGLSGTGVSSLSATVSSRADGAAPRIPGDVPGLA